MALAMFRPSPCVLLALAMVSEACSPPPLEDTAPVLILGVDGLEWNVVLPLLSDGRMPHLEELMSRGTFGTLATLEPTHSPRLWTTIATGKLPEEHGILGFVKPPQEDDDGEQLLYTRFDRRTKAFWNILNDHGVSTDVVGWWMTYPTEKVDGLMVSQTNTLKRNIPWKGKLEPGTPGQVWPTDLEDRMFDILERAHDQLGPLTTEIFGDFAAELRPKEEERWQQCLWAFRADSTYAAIIAERTRPSPLSRVTSLYIGGPDVVGHRFWSAYEPGPFGIDADAREVRLFGRVIPSYYEYVDRLIGECVASFPPDATVFLVSDHGMSAMVPKVRPDGTLRPTRGRTGEHQGAAGVFVAAGSGIACTQHKIPLHELEPEHLPELGGIQDFCPTLLAVLEIPYGEDMAGRPLKSVLDPEHLARHPLKSIATHDDPAWLAGLREGAGVSDPERIEQLRNLGYLGDDEDE